MSGETNHSTRRVPGYALVIMGVQSLVIAYFAFWAYEEYLNNAYFQNYVNASLQGSGFAIVALSSVGIFAAVASGLYMKLRRTRRELEELVTSEPAPLTSQISRSVLAPQVEQHLIDMIRKSAPAESTATGNPVLRREEELSGQLPLTPRRQDQTFASRTP